MRWLTVDDLENLRLGSAVLGSGGGGDPTYALLMVKFLMEKYGPIRLIQVDELKSDDLVVPLSIMGAPLINMERLMSGRELEILLDTVEKRLSLKPTVLMAAEIGGANAFTPLLAAAKLGLPVLDADMIGRAFPELQMSSCYLNNLAPTPAVMADCLGNSLVIETGDAKTLEKIARAVTVAVGSSCPVGFYLMRGDEVPGSVVEGSFSQALSIGKALSQSIETFMEETAAVQLATGTVIDIDQTVQEGFLEGTVTLLCEGKTMQVYYQNEYLQAKEGTNAVAVTPDIIVLMDVNSRTPIASESLRYGLQVALLRLPSPSIWKTVKGLKLVGPEIFFGDVA